MYYGKCINLYIFFCFILQLFWISFRCPQLSLNSISFTFVTYSSPLCITLYHIKTAHFCCTPYSLFFYIHFLYQYKSICPFIPYNLPKQSKSILSYFVYSQSHSCTTSYISTNFVLCPIKFLY